MNYDPMGGISNISESSAAQESKDSQSDPPPVTTSSSSTASPLLPVPLGTMIPNMWPVEVPESVKVSFHNWENLAFTEFRDQLKAVYRKKVTIASLKDHVMFKTFPPDLRHRFVPYQNLPHSIPLSMREKHQLDESNLFFECKQLILDARIVLLSEDLAASKKTLTNLQERTLLRDRLLSATPSFTPFIHAWDAHFTAFRARAEVAMNVQTEKYEAHVRSLSEASLAETARQSALSTLPPSSSAVPDMDVVMTEDVTPTLVAAPPGITVRAAAAAPTAIPPGIPRRVTVTPAPAATAESVALASLQAQMAQMSAALAQLTTGTATAPAPNRARPAASTQKSPKNSSGPGGKSTAQTSSRDGRASRPSQRREDRYDRYDRHQSRSRDRRSSRSPSRQPSRSDSSRYKRQPSPSRDRDDDRWHSNSRPRTSRRSPSPPPRRTHHDRRDDRDSDRGRSQRRVSSKRD